MNGRADRAILLFVVAVVAGGIYFVVSDYVERRHVREESCRTAHQRQIDLRRDEIEDFNDLEQFARFFNATPEELRRVAADELRPKLHGRYGNGRIPDYCEQHDWPEDERDWPAILRSPPGR